MAEVLSAFQENNVMKDLHRERTITHGKSATFPTTWKAEARYHQRGTPIVGSNNILHGQRIISIDDLLIADTVIYELDEAMNHYDVRSIHTTELGAALARAYDKRCLQVAVLAARAAGAVTGAPGGSVITDAAMATDGQVLANALFSAAQTFDEKDVPQADRALIVRPAQYYLMAATKDLLNKDWGGAGVYADGSVLYVAGIKIVKSNNLPSVNITDAQDGEQNTYYGDFSKTAGVVITKDAIGTVKLKDLAMEITSGDFRIMYQADLMVAKYAMGHGILRPECAVELSVA
ncbi:MAG: hypothetical protein IJD28_07140 [Deferribacterales bacterium]|nr:hypothetical protein [Deferribacterales bacterium]